MVKINDKLILYISLVVLGLCIISLGLLINWQKKKIDNIKEENKQIEERFHFDRVY